MSKIIKFNKPLISKYSKKNILKVLKNKDFSDGEFQKKSEELIKKLINANSVKLTQSCSSALEVAMILANIGKDDEVIVPSYTFTSTANCVLLRNSNPIFVDIDLKDVNMTAELVEKKITKKTKAIVLVHYGGVACNMDKFIKLKKKYNLFLIEDAAHAFMAKYKNKSLGTFGDFGAFSFHETKNVVGGQCGALIINNKKFINRANVILDKGTDRYLLGKKNYYSWQDIGSEYRSPELSAALLFSQLQVIKSIQSKRRYIWNTYYKYLKKINNHSFYIPFNENKNIESSYHTFPIVFKDTINRNKFIKFMKKNKIQCFFHYYPLHLSKFGKKIHKGKLENTEKIFNGLVRLPIYPDLTNNELKKILNTFKSFLR